MNVLIVTPQYWPELGGVSVLWRSTAEALVRRGHSVTVATQQRSELGALPNELVDGVHVHRFIERFGGERFGFAPSLRRWVLRHASTFDVVHLVGYHSPLALSVLGLSGAPIVFSPIYHGKGHSALANMVHVVYGRVSGRLFARASLVHCLSQSETDHLLGDVPHIVDKVRTRLSAITPSNTEVEAFPSAHPIVLMAGRLEDYKRYDLAIDAFAAVESDAQLIICGTGPAQASLQAQISARGLTDRVSLTGYVSDEDLRRWQRTADVILSLSSRETFGLVIAEGATFGARIVASDIPAHREVVSFLASEAVWVPLETTANELARLITSALQQGRQSPPQRQHTWDHVAADIEELYLEALGRVS